MDEMERAEKGGGGEKTGRGKEMPFPDFFFSFSAVLAELPAEAFVRIHRSFCVNLMHVSRLTRKSCFLDEGMELPLSRSAYQEANEAFLRYYRKRDPFC